MTQILRIGTRGSPLALWQAHHVADLLRAVENSPPVELVLIETSGDRVRDRPLTQIGGDGVFTKEIQNALLDGRVDLAVHSLKDLPTTHFAGLVLAGVPARAPTGDAFISTRHARFEALPPGAVLGTSSLRRRAQLLHRRPDLKLIDLRGNVETRLRKLDEQGLDAIILAEAGLRRLGLEERIGEVLPSAWMLPAVGQGALGLECREEDTTTRTLLARLNDPDTHRAVLAERSFLRHMGGGCQVPMGALARVANEQLTLRAAVLSVDGGRRLSDEIEGLADEAELLGQRLARRLLEWGAADVLAAVYGSVPVAEEVALEDRRPNDGLGLGQGPAV